jgi:hypothetical protein
MTETPKIVKKYALSRRATFTLGLKFIHPAPNAVEIKPAQEKVSPPSSSILQSQPFP